MVERRLTILAAIVLLWGAAILKNLISLQVVHHREYAVRARSIQEVVETYPRRAARSSTAMDGRSP
jgi:cell division protein FtsI/penicillin-binding protein 2